MVEKMTRTYERELTAALEPAPVTLDDMVSTRARRTLNSLRLRFEQLFRANSRSILDRMFGQVDKASRASLTSSLRELSGGLTIPTPDMPLALREQMQAATASNVSLIKSIPAQYHAEIEKVVLRSIQPGGNGLQDVTEALRKQELITQRRADFIARDQTRKVTSAMNSARMQSAGVKEFEWCHAAGVVDPRHLHLEYHGKTFRFDDLPIIDERTGERGLPGQLIHCHCTMRPVLRFGEM